MLQGRKRVEGKNHDNAQKGKKKGKAMRGERSGGGFNMQFILVLFFLFNQHSHVVLFVLFPYLTASRASFIRSCYLVVSYVPKYI